MFGLRKNKNTIEINGRTINVSGNNIRIANNKVYANGKLVDDFNGNAVKIIVECNVETLTTDCDVELHGNCKNITCDTLSLQGNVTGDIDANDVNINGNVNGNIDTVNINICGDVHGNVDTQEITY